MQIRPNIIGYHVNDENRCLKFIENNAKFQRTKRYLTSTLPRKKFQQFKNRYRI